MLPPSFFVALHYNPDWMKHLAYLTAGLITFVVSLAACSTGACFEETVPEVIVNMYADGTETLRKCDSIKVIAHKVIGDATTFDTLVNEKSVSSFSFSLDPLHNESTFYFELNNKKDEVTLTYNNYPHVISPECGYTIYNDILTVNATDTIIANITIDNKSVTLNGERNLRLFY